MQYQSNTYLCKWELHLLHPYLPLVILHSIKWDARWGAVSKAIRIFANENCVNGALLLHLYRVLCNTHSAVPQHSAASINNFWGNIESCIPHSPYGTTSCKFAHANYPQYRCFSFLFIFFLCSNYVSETGFSLQVRDTKVCIVNLSILLYPTRQGHGGS